MSKDVLRRGSVLAIANSIDAMDRDAIGRLAKSLCLSHERLRDEYLAEAARLKAAIKAAYFDGSNDACIDHGVDLFSDDDLECKWNVSRSKQEDYDRA